MNIESRRSIHREDRKIKTDADNSPTLNREARAKRKSNGGRITPVRGERIEYKSASIHGSQEELYEDDTSSEPEHASYATSFVNNRSGNNIRTPESSSFRSRTNNQSVRLRTESPIRPELKSKPKQKAEVPHNKCSFVIWGIALICFCTLVYFYMKSGAPKCSLNALKNKYPGESEILWKYLKSDIDDIMTGRINKPSVTLFVHSGGKKARELIKDIASASSNCIDSSMGPVEFMSSDFTSDDATNDYGVIIDKYKRTAKEGNVVMIANLNEIPAEAARALHAICDRETPIFRKVVILLSLAAEYNGERPIDIAESALSDLWKDKIMDNEFGPLMARVTDEVILLQSK